MLTNIAASSPVERMPQVAEAVSSVENLADNAMRLMAELERRLSPVIRSVPTGESAPVKDGDLVPIAYQLSSSCHKLRAVNDGLESILGRIEV